MQGCSCFKITNIYLVPAPDPDPAIPHDVVLVLGQVFHQQRLLALLHRLHPRLSRLPRADVGSLLLPKIGGSSSMNMMLNKLHMSVEYLKIVLNVPRLTC